MGLIREHRHHAEEDDDDAAFVCDIVYVLCCANEFSVLRLNCDQICEYCTSLTIILVQHDDHDDHDSDDDDDGDGDGKTAQQS